MIIHRNLSKEKLHHFIRKKKITFAGNTRLNIYGLLNCKSGKRMKKQNRVFFESEREAVQNKFRPCGHCMKEAYLLWGEKAPDTLNGS